MLPHTFVFVVVVFFFLPLLSYRKSDIEVKCSFFFFFLFYSFFNTMKPT